MPRMERIQNLRNMAARVAPSGRHAMSHSVFVPAGKLMSYIGGAFVLATIPVFVVPRIANRCARCPSHRLQLQHRRRWTESRARLAHGGCDAAQTLALALQPSAPVLPPAGASCSALCCARSLVRGLRPRSVHSLQSTLLLAAPQRCWLRVALSGSPSCAAVWLARPRTL